MNRNVKIKQHDYTDCGATCIASIAAFYNKKLPLSKIRQMTSTDKQGANVLGLIEAAEQLDFLAKGVKALSPAGEKLFEPLHKIPLPAIAHVTVRENFLHYVVIYKVTEKYIEIMDPVDGLLHKQSIEEFGKIWTGVLVLLVPNEEFRPLNSKISPFARFWFLLKPHKSVMLQALIGALVTTVLGLSMSIYVQKIIDNVIPNSNGNLLNLLSVAMIVILLLQIAIGYMRSIFVFKTGQQIDARLILGYYKHLLHLPQSFFDSMRVGEINSRLADAVNIRAFINETIPSFFVSIFILAFAIALMFSYYWKLALIIFGIIPFYLIIFLFYNYVNKRTQRKLMEEAAEVESQLVESLNVAETIKRFGVEDFVNTKTENKYIKLIRTGFRSGVNGLISGTASEFFSQLFTIILLWCGSYFVLKNFITTGELLSFYTLIGYFMSPVSGLINMNKAAQDALIAADRLFEIMDLEQEAGEQKMKIKSENLGDIVFDKISFRYGTRKQIFEDFSLTFEQGQITAIVGESGCGKTTIMSLLQNMYPLQSGNIRIGNIDIRHIHPNSLRKAIGIVPQKIDLFSGNVLDNIALGEQMPDIESVIKICKEINILPFIESLPQGFQTYIGENGTQLSGGQRQRIAIARALYKQPAILMLDEATSSLDPEAEEYITRTIQKFSTEGKTIITIAHRLSTIAQSNKIYFLHKGKIMEQGTHSELLALGGRYADYWKHQTGL